MSNLRMVLSKSKLQMSVAPMTKPIDLLRMGPTRSEVRVDGHWVVIVSPPAWSGFSKGHTVVLTDDQHERYLRWRTTGVLIQDALPELTGEQREILMTGLGPEDWPAEEEEE